MLRFGKALCLFGLLSGALAKDYDCDADLTITSTDDAAALFEACPTLTGEVEFDIEDAGAELVYPWSQSNTANVYGPNLTFVLGGPDTESVNMTRLYLQAGVARFELGEALEALTVFDLGVSGSEAFDEASGEEDPCDDILRTWRESGARIEVAGCGMSPNITVDWGNGLEGAAAPAGRRGALGLAAGLGLVTAMLML